ncbi:MAG: prolyl-tRNA synthetase associated domain-containing protein [Acetobacteraceae bacterium]|nr:prolyl-tRNA synthetase associated domain-containing protein [Acetobacteraceae bacterium]
MIPASLSAALGALGLAPVCHVHAPLRTVEDAHAIWDGLAGAQVKNLFIKDAGRQYWLVVVPGDPRMDTKALAPLIGSKRISFGSADDLRAILGVEPGSVTPLAMMNDARRQVRLVIHAPLMRADRLLVHPLVNTATLEMAPGDLARFLDAHDVAPALVDLSAAFLAA